VSARPLELQRPRDVTALFGDAVRVLLSRPGTFLALSAAIVVPAELVVSGIGLEALTAPYDSSPSTAEYVIPSLVGFLVIAPLITATCIHALRSVASGRPLAAGPALIEGFEAFTPLFLAVVLAALGIALGLLALILPGIYLLVRWMFVPQAVVVEGARGPAALTRSGEVVRGNWWRAFGILVLANLAAFVPGLALAAPGRAIAEAADRELYALIGSMAAEIVTAPFVAVLSTLLYYDLRARRYRP
jgi:hypothetical protein